MQRMRSFEYHYRDERIFSRRAWRMKRRMWSCTQCRTHVIARSWGVSAWKAGRESELLPLARLFWCCFQSKQAATNTATLDQRPRRRPFARSKSILDHVLLELTVIIISAPCQLFLDTPLYLRAPPRRPYRYTQ